MLAQLGAPRVVCTDNDPRCIALCVANAESNGCVARAAPPLPPAWRALFPFSPAKPTDAEDPQGIVHSLQWGAEGDRELASAVSAAGGRCPLVVAADVLYDPDPLVHAALEHTLRMLILRGGCTQIVLSWTVCPSLSPTPPTLLLPGG
jgi:predicted nicotinamide N-methyase